MKTINIITCNLSLNKNSFYSYRKKSLKNSQPEPTRLVAAGKNVKKKTTNKQKTKTKKTPLKCKMVQIDKWIKNRWEKSVMIERRALSLSEEGSLFCIR